MKLTRRGEIVAVTAVMALLLGTALLDAWWTA